MSIDKPSEGTEFLRELRRTAATEDQIFASLQQELRKIASAKMRRERVDHTLQPTALINEAYLKIQKRGLPTDLLQDSSKALRLIAHAMEQVLNDHADSHNAEKRGGLKKQRVPLDENQAREFAGETDPPPLLADGRLMIAPQELEKILTMRKCLDILRKAHPRQAEVIQLQFYCGFTQEEVAEIMGVSLELVKLDTRKAKAFMKTIL